MLRRLIGRIETGSASRSESEEPGLPARASHPPDAEASFGGEPVVYRYEDILRAVGHFIDEEGLQDVVILQTEAGVLVRGMRRSRAGSVVTPTLKERLFSKGEIAAILEEGRRRRGTGSKLFQ